MTPPDSSFAQQVDPFVDILGLEGEGNLALQILRKMGLATLREVYDLDFAAFGNEFVDISIKEQQVSDCLQVIRTGLNLIGTTFAADHNHWGASLRVATIPSREEWCRQISVDIIAVESTIAGWDRRFKRQIRDHLQQDDFPINLVFSRGGAIFIVVPDKTWAERFGADGVANLVKQLGSDDFAWRGRELYAVGKCRWDLVDNPSLRNFDDALRETTGEIVRLASTLHR